MKLDERREIDELASDIDEPTISTRQTSGTEWT
jgi:hypothetical protein